MVSAASSFNTFQVLSGVGVSPTAMIPALPLSAAYTSIISDISCTFVILYLAVSIVTLSLPPFLSSLAIPQNLAPATVAVPSAPLKVITGPAALAVCKLATGTIPNAIATTSDFAIVFLKFIILITSLLLSGPHPMYAKTVSLVAIPGWLTSYPMYAKIIRIT